MTLKDPSCPAYPQALSSLFLGFLYRDPPQLPLRTNVRSKDTGSSDHPHSCSAAVICEHESGESASVFLCVIKQFGSLVSLFWPLKKNLRFALSSQPLPPPSTGHGTWSHQLWPCRERQWGELAFATTDLSLGAGLVKNGSPQMDVCK